MKRKICLIFYLLILFSISVYANVDLTRTENENEPIYIEYEGQTTLVSNFIVKNNNFFCSVKCSWNTSQGKEGIVPGIIKARDISPQFSINFEAIKGTPGNLVVDVTVFCNDVNSTFCSDSNFGIDTKSISVNYNFCGDGKANNEEECDKDDKKSKSCTDFDYSGGSLSCNDNCKLVFDNCHKCGDGKVSPGEQCDGTDFNEKNCTSLGFSGGSLTCSENCIFDTSACYNCGNNKIDLDETCKTCPSDVKCSEGEECNPNREEANQFGCAPKCGNNLCDANENYETCPNDCKKPIKCGDGICDPSENCNSCKEDCACLDGYICSGGKCILKIKYEEKKEKSFTILLFIIILLILIGYPIFIYYKKRKSIKEFSIQKREISVIMFTDIKDFSKKVGENEQKTLRKLWIYENIMNNLIKKYDGKIIKTIGDSIMCEFKSAINAVKCAKEIQNVMSIKKDFLIRIGIHMGEITHKKKDLFGEVVNIAARIEKIAEPGTVYISEDVYRQVHNKLSFNFIDLGLKSLKNIKGLIRIYKI